MNSSLLPSGWLWCPLRRLGRFKAGSALTSESIDPQAGEVPVFGGNGPRGFTDGFTHEGTFALIGRQGALCGNVNVARGRIWATEHAIVMTPSVFAPIGWLSGLLEWADLGRLSQSAAQPGIAIDDILGIEVPLPPHDERAPIADFLERETSQIDAMIEAQHGLITALEERRAAIVLEATVSRWTHRPPARLSRLLTRLDRPIPKEAGVVTAYRDGEVTLRSNRRDDGYTFSETEGGYQGVAPGDVVFHALDGFAGAVGVSDSTGKCSPVYHVCRATAGNDANFMSHLLRALGLSGFLTAYAWSVRQRSVDYRNWSLFGALPVRVPGFDDQRRVVEEIRDSLGRIDTMITAASEAIVLMQERRGALISAAVTGRIDPRTGKETTPEKVLESV